MKRSVLSCLILLTAACLIGAALADGVPAVIRQPIEATLNQRMSLRSGPNTRYTELGTYPQTTAIVVYEQEMGNEVPWGMVEFRVKGGLIRAYTGMKRIDVTGSVPWGNTKGVDAIVGSDVIPFRGPGNAYIPCDKTLPAYSAVTVYAEENGYAMVDFYYPDDTLMTRAYVPVDCLLNYQPSGGSYTDPSYWPSNPSAARYFRTFDAAGNSTAFVDLNGVLWMMGGNEHGEMGVGAKGDNVISPRQVLTNVADVQLGFYFSMALDSLGNAYAWGWNNHGQVGIGNTQNQYITWPTRIRLGDVVQLAAGDEHGVALISNGAVYTWGRNTRGQLANGRTSDVDEPAQITVPGNVVSVAAGDYNTAVILSDGTLWMAGDNTCGQLCRPASDQPYASFVQIPLNNVVRVAMGDYHAAAITADGSLYVWGSNEYGQVGNWQVKNATTPIFIRSGVRQVETGDYHTFAVTDDGELYAWGRNDNGQLGDGSTSHCFRPTLVMRDVWMLDTGYAHTIVVKYDNTIWGVGRNKYGALGLRNTGNITKWTQISPMGQ